MINKKRKKEEITEAGLFPGFNYGRITCGYVGGHPACNYAADFARIHEDCVLPADFAGFRRR